ncbi:FAD-dependent monooxygenase [Pseudomonas sp.]|uniref:FAD-dependent monooxygenase n=1 Tax=Pseudomonas sp. TaxID=306 RepID=UPI0028AEB050|nr:FAD-dependent monooxygenase [Pseudomonas sp.]
METDVIVVGAGPTGMVLALWLKRFGVDVQIVDKASGPGTQSRALAVQARTLELYQQSGLTDALLKDGHRAEVLNLWVEGERKAQVHLGNIGEGITPFPYLLIYPQDQHERLLEQHLANAGLSVQRECEVVAVEDKEDLVRVYCQAASGASSILTARYVVGCDGAGSIVRKGLNIGFPGGTYEQRFYVADIVGSGACLDGNLHVDLDDVDFIAVFGMQGTGAGRVVGIVPKALEAKADLNFEDVRGRAIRQLGLQVDTVKWFSSYRVHHRVADRFRVGRVFLAGDAGHVHSPAGGQGMNTGIGDAINLAWKLSAVVKGEADTTLLESYERERIAFARKLVATTDRAFSLVTSKGKLAQLVRTRGIPTVMPLAARAKTLRRLMFRTVSQTAISYRDGPLAEGSAGNIHGGDRMPWVNDGLQDNFRWFAAAKWQVHVYGTPTPALEQWCASESIALNKYEWCDAADVAGVHRDAAYLIRPDSYVAVVTDGSPEMLDAFFRKHGISIR